MDKTNTITVEVAFALAKRQKLVRLQLPEGTTAQEAIEVSDIGRYFPGWDVVHLPAGLFGKVFGSKNLPAKNVYRVKEGDRIELYRPLQSEMH